MSTADESPLRLRYEDSFTVGYVSNLYVLLRAIDDAFPKEAILYVEGTSIAPPISEFLRARQATVMPTVEPSTVFPEPSVFHLPLRGTNLEELRALAEHQAEAEVADHLVVYLGREVLLWAADAGANEVQLSRSLEPRTVERFTASLGATLQKRE